MNHQYLWHVALMIEGCDTENSDNIHVDTDNHPCVRLSKTLSYLCRHDKEHGPNTSGFVSIEDILPKTKLVENWKHQALC